MLRTVTRDPAQTAYRVAGGEHPQPVDGRVVEAVAGLVRVALGFPFYADEWFGRDGEGVWRALGPRLPEVADTLWPVGAPEVAERRDAADAPMRAALHANSDTRWQPALGPWHDHFPRAGTHDVVPLAPASMARYL